MAGASSRLRLQCPSARGWAVAGRQAWLPAIGRHEVLIVDTDTWQEVGRMPFAQ